ncbi:IS110-like element ISCps7 family transposase [Colwellia psychrerythraea]|uniref:ISCps7, transposase n=1 Tax=Colwellia psychrerythraea (strain 34H / ATCC BAA-681) TaxID=167879 RepID=Q480R5_COLP3|nr:IS110-like element ISCps7 family transposase [Colwellia psychrerythraea]AAZ26237.1 ISCps7, transposase [Colwellia psychrerythraea 34H]
MNTQINQNEINVGVDTGKTQLDIYIRPLGIYFTVTNDEDGIKTAMTEIKKHKVTRVVIEATGRLEQAFIMACAKAKIPFVIANPVNIKRFAGAINQKAKTDKLDAQLIAHYAEAIKPTLSQLKPEQIRLMSDLLSRRRQLMDMQTMEKNRLQIMPKEITSSIKPVLTVLKNQLEKIDNKIHKLIESCDEYKIKNDIIQSAPGVGKVVAFNLISEMPELGYINNKEAASLVGVAPFNRESGSYKGKRMIRGGRSQIRTAMYMAMMSAIQCNPTFKTLYQRLVAVGKPKKVAIIACIRKLVITLNSMVRDGVYWDPKMN